MVHQVLWMMRTLGCTSLVAQQSSNVLYYVFKRGCQWNFGNVVQFLSYFPLNNFVSRQTKAVCSLSNHRLKIGTLFGASVIMSTTSQELNSGSESSKDCNLKLCKNYQQFSWPNHSSLTVPTNTYRLKPILSYQEYQYFQQLEDTKFIHNKLDLS